MAKGVESNSTWTQQDNNHDNVGDDCDCDDNNNKSRVPYQNGDAWCNG